MTRLERRYRLLLRAYPGGYRADYGDELLDILLTRAEADRAVPQAREAAALVAGGIRTRIVAAAQGPAWTDGLHLAVTAISLVNLAVLVPYTSSIPLWVAASALTFLAVLRGLVLVALPLATLTGGKVLAITLAEPWLDRTLLPVFPDHPWETAPALYAIGGPVAPATGYLLMILGLLALAIRGGPARHRSWWWLAALPLVVGASPAWRDIVEGTPNTMFRVGLETALLCVAAYAGHLTADPRWAVAAGAYALPTCVTLAENLTDVSRQEITHGALVILLTLITATAPFRARRRVLL